MTRAIRIPRTTTAICSRPVRAFPRANGWVAGLLADVELARKKAAAAVRDTTSTRSATLTEDTTE